MDDKAGAVEHDRTRVEEVLRESERYQAEGRTLRDSLAARDATIVQVLHSLGERDAQLSTLQAEHAKVLPVLEALAKTGTQLEQELSPVPPHLPPPPPHLKATPPHRPPP